MLALALLSFIWVIAYWRRAVFADIHLVAFALQKQPSVAAEGEQKKAAKIELISSCKQLKRFDGSVINIENSKLTLFSGKSERERTSNRLAFSDVYRRQSARHFAKSTRASRHSSAPFYERSSSVSKRAIAQRILVDRHTRNLKL